MLPLGVGQCYVLKKSDCVRMNTYTSAFCACQNIKDAKIGIKQFLKRLYRQKYHIFHYCELTFVTPNRSCQHIVYVVPLKCSCISQKLLNTFSPLWIVLQSKLYLLYELSEIAMSISCLTGTIVLSVFHRNSNLGVLFECFRLGIRLRICAAQSALQRSSADRKVLCQARFGKTQP